MTGHRTLDLYLEKYNKLDRMQMFETLLNSIPKNRSEMVNDLEIPEVALTPYFLTDTDESLNTRSESELTGTGDEYDPKTFSTDSSLSLSRAMTDSEIDYERYRRLKSRSLSDPWCQMRTALDAFPPAYLASLCSFQESTSNATDDVIPKQSVRQYNEELRLKMERFFAEECRVFTPDDPSLITLEEALQSIDLKYYDCELGSLSP